MLRFREAEEKDMPLLLLMIKELADYEKKVNEVKATVEDLRHTICERKCANVIFVMLDDVEIGFALYFFNYSTWLAKPGLYIEDLYIREEYRNRGYGKETIKELCRIAKKRECGRVEWWCLDYNTPSIKFYTDTLKAEKMDEWTVYRLEGESLNALTNEVQLFVSK